MSFISITQNARTVRTVTSFVPNVGWRTLGLPVATVNGATPAATPDIDIDVDVDHVWLVRTEGDVDPETTPAVLPPPLAAAIVINVCVVLLASMRDKVASGVMVAW